MSNNSSKKEKKQKSYLGHDIEPLCFLTAPQTYYLLSENRQIVVLIRHGITDWNLEAKLQGRVEIPMNDIGIKQVTMCAEKISNAVRNIKVKNIYCSPLLRAKDSAKILADKLVMPEPVVYKGLIERDYGSITGTTYDQRRALLKQTKKYPADVEPVQHAAERMKKELLKIYNDEGDGISIVVTHGGIINSTYSHLTKGKAGTFGNIAANCSLNILAVGKKDVIPVAFNLSPEIFKEYINELHNYKNQIKNNK